MVPRGVTLETAQPEKQLYKQYRFISIALEIGMIQRKMEKKENDKKANHDYLWIILISSWYVSAQNRKFSKYR